MPALAADILRATREARIVTRVDTAVQSAFPGARDAANDPEPGLFEAAADASTVLTLKAALIGQFRRRFVVQIADEIWVDPLTGVPTWRLVDSETGVDANCLLCRLELDMENETTAVEVLG